MTRASPSLHPLAGLAAAPRWARALQVALLVAVVASVPAAWCARAAGVTVAPRQTLTWPTP